MGSQIETLVGYHFNYLDEPVLMKGPKPLMTEFGIIADD